MSFPTRYEAIIEQIHQIDPVAYGHTRNFVDGAVTRLSPYLSRGVISTRMVMEHILSLGHPTESIEKLIQELAWRDYWQQVWIAKGDQINEDLKQPQTDVIHHQMPRALIQANTGIEAIDRAIQQYYEDGYLHNHLRMYIASLACNAAKSHWRTPAYWLYYHLLDGDWASNALSWQWVAGANANKKYYANQENINHYCHTDQKGTYLDVSYEQLPIIEVPVELRETEILKLITPLPATKAINLDPNLPTLLYNYYNLDPNWRSDEKANRLLLLEPSIFERYPISARPIQFMLDLAENIPGIQVYVGEFEELVSKTGTQPFIFKEHPLNNHYRGIEDSRDWMFTVKGYFPSFFAFWKQCKKEWV